MKTTNPQLLSSAHHGQVLSEGAHRLDGHEKGEKLVYGGGCHSVSQCLQYEKLHVHQLLPGVGVVSGVHKVVQLRRVDLLVFPTASITLWDVYEQSRVKSVKASTYAAIVIAAVPTSCSLFRLMLIVWERKRST